MDGHPVTVAPEFEDCARAAREHGVPARDVYEEALRLAREALVAEDGGPPAGPEPDEA
jgi:uncharacterized protein (DUF111 family)